MLRKPGYFLGRFWADRPKFARAILAIAVLGALSWFMTPARLLSRDDNDAETFVRAEAAATAAAAETKRRAAATECQAVIESRRDRFYALVAAGRLWDAHYAIGNCAELVGDQTLQAAQRNAHINAFIGDTTNKKASSRARLNSLEAFVRTFPNEAARYAELGPSLTAQAERDDALAAKAAAIALAKKKKREGVTLGMTQEDVLASNWGRPNKVNRTIYSHGTHEQWVYDGGYLYFEGGILVTIQN